MTVSYLHRLVDSLPDLLGVVSVATSIPYEEIEKLGLAEIVRLIKAVFEVNNYSEVYETVKKALAHPVIKDYTKTVIQEGEVIVEKK